MSAQIERPVLVVAGAEEERIVNPPYSPLMSALEDRIAQDEGFRRHVYRCPAGRLTIGYGWMIEDGISEEEALVLMRYRLLRIHADLGRRLSWYAGISIRRRHALINMAYQLGVDGLMGFRRMLAAAAQGEWATAAREALDSKWARSDSPSRARRVVKLLEQG